MHRISLRGPWNLELVDDRIEVSRKFHAPPGFGDSSARDSEIDTAGPPISLHFHWRSAIEWPIDHLWVNERVIRSSASIEAGSQSGEFFYWDALEGVGRVELTGILKSFNKIVMVWRRWPSDWRPTAGRYSPFPQHTLHFDSWLDIQS